MRHFYSGEKKPILTIQKVVHVMVMNRHKQPWVITKSFGVQKVNKAVNIFTVESTPTESPKTPLLPTVGDCSSDKEENDDCTTQKPEETHSKKVSHLFRPNLLY